MTGQTTGERSLMGRWFPTRYVYLRDGDEVRAWALTPGRQAFGAFAAVLLGGWFLVASGGFALDLIMQSQADRAVARARAASERLNADLQTFRTAASEPDGQERSARIVCRDPSGEWMCASNRVPTGLTSTSK